MKIVKFLLFSIVVLCGCDFDKSGQVRMAIPMPDFESILLSGTDEISSAVCVKLFLNDEQIPLAPDRDALYYTSPLTEEKVIENVEIGNLIPAQQYQVQIEVGLFDQFQTEETMTRYFEGSSSYFTVSPGETTPVNILMQAPADFNVSISPVRIEPAGLRYIGSQEVSFYCETADSTIYYTSDGTDPTLTNGTAVAHGSSISLTESATIKAVAFKSYYQSPPVSVSHYSRERYTTIIVEGGAFTMGKTGVAEPLHQVSLDSFYIGKFEVLQSEYEAITGLNPSDVSKGIDPGYPVNVISWYDAIEFCNLLSLKEGLEPAYLIDKTTPDPNNLDQADTVKWSVSCDLTKNGYRLPTEAEWEYAASGGALSQNFIYAGSNNADEVAWYDANSSGLYHAAGLKKPNELGIYDMSGNTYEWCWDWLGNYGAEAQTNPLGPVSGSRRVFRGGCWSYAVGYTRVHFRFDGQPQGAGHNRGFRIVRSY